MKTLITLFITLLVVGIIALVALPSALSSKTGLNLAMNLASRQLPGTLSAKSWELAWTGKQRLSGFRYTDEEVGLEIDLPTFELQDSLIVLLTKSRDEIKLQVAGEAHLHQSDGEELSIRALEAALSLSPRKNQITANIHGIPHYRKGEGKLTVQATLGQSGLDANAELQDFPGRLIAAFFRSEPLGALLGDTVQLNAKTQTHQGKGLLQVRVDASHSQWDLDASIHKGLITLNKAFRGEITVNREVSRLVLKHINPLLITAIGAPEPIRLTVAPEGFHIPIDLKALTNAEMPLATIEFGRITVENGGPLEAIMGLVQSSTVRHSDRMETWFTPQYLHLKDGILVLERMDTLIHQSFHLATWGTVDLLRDYVDITLGIPQDTLRERFGIKGLSEDYVLQTPLQGRSDRVDLDYASVLARIASMRARSSSQEASQVLGLFLDAVTGQKQEEGQAAPKPTTQPFPWGDSWRRKKDSSRQQSTVEESEDPSPIKDIPVKRLFDLFR